MAQLKERVEVQNYINHQDYQSKDLVFKIDLRVIDMTSRAYVTLPNELGRIKNS